VPSKVRALGLPTLHVAADADAAYEAWLPAASSILQGGLRCVVEVWGDTPDLRWQPRLLTCDDDLDGVEAAIEEWIETAPQHSARVAGYARDRLARVDAAPAALCHVAGAP
jgi:hypothetical protein